MATATPRAIAQAIAARFAAAQVTPPTGYDNIRWSTEQTPNQLPPTPGVLVFPDGGDYRTGTGSRAATQKWKVRFYYDQAADLTRSSAALLDWLDPLSYQLRGAAQLGGLVDRCTLDAWKAGLLTYADLPYAGIEFDVTTVTTEGWGAAA